VTLSDADRERIRRWHERAYAEVAARTEPEVFHYLGRTITVPPDVQPITGMSHLLGRAVLDEVRETDRVLDMGTGSGVNAILAASKARSVLAVDINPAAITAARANAAANGVVIEVRESDVFESVDGAFDLIVCDPPFRPFKPRTLLEAATTDENYAALTRFFAEVDDHLAPGGRIVLFFGSSGDIGYVRELIARFRCEVVATERLTREGLDVDYFTFRLSR
jgi:release factor glutamine methyltransferase